MDPAAAHGLNVTPENVLQAHNLVRAEAMKLKAQMLQHRPMLEVKLCGTDPVSYAARDGFNAKITAMVDNFDQYVEKLEQVADALKTTARDYGITEDHITSSFDAYRKSQAFIGPKVMDARP